MCIGRPENRKAPVNSARRQRPGKDAKNTPRRIYRYGFEIHPFHAPLFSDRIRYSKVNNIEGLASLLFISTIVQATTRDAIHSHNEGATHTNMGNRMQQLNWFPKKITVPEGAMHLNFLSGFKANVDVEKKQTGHLPIK